MRSVEQQQQDDAVKVREMKADKHRNNKRLPDAQCEEGNLLRQLLNQTLHPRAQTEQLLEVRLYKVSIPNKSSEHDCYTVSATGLLKSYVPLPVY